MKKILVFCLFILFGCSGSPRNHEAMPVGYIDINSLVNSNYKEIKDVNFWNDDIQTGIYHYFFLNDNIAAVIEFRDFMEELDREKVEAYENSEKVSSSYFIHMRPSLVNPIIVLIQNHYYIRNSNRDLNIEYLSTIYNERPHLLFQGNRNNGGTSGSYYSHPPLVEAVVRRKINIVTFFIENIENWENVENTLYSDWHMSSHPHLGGNLLGYLPAWDDRRLHNLLVERGIEEYIDISQKTIYVSTRIYVRDSQGTNIWTEPDFNSRILKRIGNEEKLKPILITAFKVGGHQWVYFETEDGTRGWAPYFLSIGYDSGI